MWRTKYPIGLGNWVPGSAPRVHAGFLTTWQKNGLSERLVERLCQIVSTRRDSPHGVKIYITGGEALHGHTVKSLALCLIEIV